jgi:protein arginine phosphatase
MAEALFNARAKKNNDEWRARSAGTWASENQSATSLAIQALAERGIIFNRHRAHQITAQDLEQSDLVLVMTRNHRDALVSEFPAQKKKIHLMSELEGRQYDIGDPYGGVLEEYRARAQELDALIERGYDRIKQWTGNKAD